ncbi:hypothetical protein ACULNC_13480 [Shigella flexneri]
MEGSEVGRYFADHETGRYKFHQEPAHILMKVETTTTRRRFLRGRARRPVPAVKSAMKVPPGAARSRKLVWLVSPYPTCEFAGFEQPWEEDFG